MRLNGLLLSGRDDLLAALLLDAENSAAKELIKTVRARLPIYRGTSLIRNCAPPNDRHKALGIVLLKGARVELSIMSEVLL